ncbi:hypothetical protein Q5425_44860 [Amycolatopsis sp. A133]|uniref:hypothetical protein n=1 Tax=Amycolatopsis sp. A133 TaxID=3064472 RepID=UPI0027FF61FC|nr:hypothetical protein [Amycolatopsis sp. A133]MDQ7810899.1 hypothetical protein [Amycolatopsis sp. A133]
MRPNVLGIFSLVALAAAAALAIQQSPNFSSLTTGLSIMTADSPDYRSVVVPLPYRETPRTISAPVPEKDFATAWSAAPPPSSGPAPAPEPMSGMEMGSSGGHDPSAGVAPSTGEPVAGR